MSLGKILSAITAKTWTTEPSRFAEELAKQLELAVLKYTGGTPDDDLAILVMEVKKGVKWNPQKTLVAKELGKAKKVEAASTL